MNPEPLPLNESAPPEQHPFWGYRDLLMLVGLSLPCLLGGVVIAKALSVLFSVPVNRKALVVLPATFLGYGLLFLALYLILRMQYDRPFWASLAWIRGPQPVGVVILCGVLLALAVGLLGHLLRTPDIESPMKDLLKDRTSILLVAFFATTLGPACEELVFRGFAQPLLVRSLGVIPGILATAIPFGLLHLEQYSFSWRHGLLISLAGAAFGWARQRWGSTAQAALMHAAYNLTFFVAYLAQTKDLPKTW
jgi:uncharacterized protein